jgi:uncharacterized protein
MARRRVSGEEIADHFDPLPRGAGPGERIVVHRPLGKPQRANEDTLGLCGRDKEGEAELPKREPGIFAGLDLSGPANHDATALVWCSQTKDGLAFIDSRSSLSDADLENTLAGLAEADVVTLAIDAPLSYNDGGGSRPADVALRRAVMEVGMRPGAVMAPTMDRMVYLTLRGHGLARRLELVTVANSLRIIETHPGAVFGLNGAAIQSVLDFRSNRISRIMLIAWLGRQGVSGLPLCLADTSHDIAACGAAYAAWQSSLGRSRWQHLAKPPEHPYDFCC